MFNSLTETIINAYIVLFLQNAEKFLYKTPKKYLTKRRKISLQNAENIK